MAATEENNANFDALDPHLYLLPPNNFSMPSQLCSSRLLHFSMWFVSALSIVIALLALAFNALLSVSAFFARPIPFPFRRSLAIIASSYALLSGVLLAKKAFWLASALSASSPCVPLVSSIGCKVQEFPVVFAYLHSLASPLAFTLWMCTRCLLKAKWAQNNGRGRKEESDGQWNNQRRRNSNNNEFVPAPPPWLSSSATSRRRSSSVPPASPPASFPLFWVCSAQQIALIVLCLVLALLFTAFDQEPMRRRKMLVNCSLPLAIRHKELLFVLLTLILSSQLIQAMLWHFFIPTSPQRDCHSASSSRRPSLLLNYLLLSFRDLFRIEALLWSLSAFFTGFVIFQQFVLTKPCGKCTRLLVELSFTTLPLLIALLHPILSVLIIAPISYSAQRLCPLLSKVLAPQEPATPPLPSTFPKVRILITEH